jgi:uncharacterized protein (TIGR02678 family)
MLEDQLTGERAQAVRGLLARPLLDAEADRDLFLLVVRHGSWLTNYFEQTCGWTLTIDAAAGFVRLAKRAVDLDRPRPLRRSRGDGAPFDRRRYQLLFGVCAQLVRHPVTTVGLLAASVFAEAGLDTGRYGDRSAFVDAVRVLVGWGILRVSSGEIDAFADSAQANAILTADTARLHRLIVSAAAPGSLAEGISTDAAIDRLAAEPRYGAAGDPDGSSDEQRNRWARHRLGRRLLDDPVLYLDDLTAAERDYAASISGRRWLRDRAAEAGFDLEERSEGLLAADPDAVATDMRFPAPHGNAFQLALLLADRLVPTGVDDRRILARLEPEDLRAEVDRILARYPAWARGSRDGDGPMRIAADAVDLLVAHGLVRRDPDKSVIALPALARYRIAEPVVHDQTTLFSSTPFQEDTDD